MMGHQLTFAIDFDGTFTACPELWAIFVRAAESAGHRVFIFTAREDNDENRQEVRSALKAVGLTLPQIYTNRGSKLLAAKERGIHVDVWIEDDIERAVSGF